MEDLEGGRWGWAWHKHPKPTHSLVSDVILLLCPFTNFTCSSSSSSSSSPTSTTPPLPPPTKQTKNGMGWIGVLFFCSFLVPFHSLTFDVTAIYHSHPPPTPMLASFLTRFTSIFPTHFWESITHATAATTTTISDIRLFFFFAFCCCCFDFESVGVFGNLVNRKKRGYYKTNFDNDKIKRNKSERKKNE